MSLVTKPPKVSIPQINISKGGKKPSLEWLTRGNIEQECP